jgi:hypothetical protein
MVTVEIIGKTAVATILNDTGGEDLEVSFDEGGDHIFLRQEGDDGADVVALTPMQAMRLMRILELALYEGELLQ